MSHTVIAEGQRWRFVSTVVEPREYVVEFVGEGEGLADRINLRRIGSGGGLAQVTRKWLLDPPRNGFCHWEPVA